MSSISQTAQIDDGAQGEPVASTPRKPLGELLVGAGLIDDGQLNEAVYEGSQTGERIGEVVVRRGWATEDDVARLLAEQWELSYVDRASIWFDADALARLSREDAQLLEALPIRVEGDRVMVAVAEPTEQRLEKLRRMIGENTVVVVVPKTALDAGIRSELLRSRGHASPAEPEHEHEHEPVDGEPAAEQPVLQDESAAEEPAPEEEPSMDEPVAEQYSVDEDPVTEPAPLADERVASTPRTALREVRVDDARVEAPTTVATPRGGDDVATLAHQARNVADWIAGQTGAIREYERRIAALEAELAASQTAAQETKTQLAAVLQLLDVLRPSV